MIIVKPLKHVDKGPHLSIKAGLIQPWAVGKWYV